MVDNITPVVQKVETAEQKLGNTVKTTTQSVDSQKIAFIAEITAISACYRGINMLSGSMQELGLINDNTAAALRKVSAGVGLVLGAYQAMRGAVAIVNALKTSETVLAMVQTYRAALKNPMYVGVAAAGLATAAGVGGYLMGKNTGNSQASSTSVSQSFSFNGGNASNQRSVARDALEIMGG